MKKELTLINICSTILKINKESTVTYKHIKVMSQTQYPLNWSILKQTNDNANYQQS